MNDKQEPKQNPVLRADHQATIVLKENHRDEFNKLKREAAAYLGVEWTPPPSEEEIARQKQEALEAKAREEQEALYAKYSFLRPQTSVDGSTVVGSDDELPLKEG